ncbi:prothymosin alpha-like isoform X1 [Sinocyclocheilus anshuiensis]|uniref:prothymosin alpha-like isoform X1 n=1 Tax=Sinocyclocheilus anshuiensis TaxID=1608454 RepID=UPI0007B88A90|nr:PREDICTED: prothymosin alpha-like isoform X1 [Sinocyclocheilus anshuiensis]
MADTAVDTTTTPEITAKDLKEKKEVVEEAAEAVKENGSEDAPANGNGTVSTNGASHEEEETHEDEEGGDDEEAGEAEEEENGAEEEADGQPVKRPAEEEEAVKTKKQKTEENGDSTEAEVQA